MTKTYFTYDINKANTEGASKAFLSTEAGGGSFLFTDKIVSSESIKNSADGSIKVVKSYTKEELLASIAGIEEAKNRKNNFDHLTGEEEYNPFSVGSSSKDKTRDKIAEMRAHYESPNDSLDPSYDRDEIIHGFEGNLSRQRMKKTFG